MTELARRGVIRWHVVLRRNESLQDRLLVRKELLRRPAAIQGTRIDRMSLGVEDVAAGVHHALAPLGVDYLAFGAGIMNKVVGVEEKVQVLGGFRKEKGLHSVRFAMVPDIVDGRVAARGSRAVLQASQDVHAHLDQIRIPGRPVKIHDGFYELRPQRIALPVGPRLGLRYVVELRGKSELLPHAMVIVQGLHRVPDLAEEAQHAGPIRVQRLKDR